MDIKDIKAIYKFLRETDIVEIEIEGEQGKLKLKRGNVAIEPLRVEPAYAPPLPKVETAPGAIPEQPKAEAKQDNIKVLTSPMVGTFYRAASPEAQSFVEMGSIVKSGQALCIIEAMKLMNEVESEYNGKVVAILVENGQPVEYGEPLFHIETGPGK